VRWSDPSPRQAPATRRVAPLARAAALLAVVGPRSIAA
jgi:hypothetical protein